MLTLPSQLNIIFFEVRKYVLYGYEWNLFANDSILSMACIFDYCSLLVTGRAKRALAPIHGQVCSWRDTQLRNACFYQFLDGIPSHSAGFWAEASGKDMCRLILRHFVCVLLGFDCIPSYGESDLVSPWDDLGPAILSDNIPICYSSFSPRPRGVWDV
jgi:hypothetical protein